MPLSVGTDAATGTQFEWTVDTLRRHVAVLGSSGSGKTVLCKVLVEEAVRNGIPVIAVDPQGDVASLTLPEDAASLAQRGTPLQLQQEFLDKARVAVFTPASTKGIPLSVNPLRFPGLDVPREEVVLAIDMTAASLAAILGYDLNSPPGKAARAGLFSVMDYSLQQGAPPKDLSELARIILDPPPGLDDRLAELIVKKDAEELARKLKYLTVGASSLLFEMGVKLDLGVLLDRRDGKVPVNVVYLNTLTSEADKQFFLTALLREVYLWMLKHPSNDVQLLLYVDEIAPYIPPYPRNPPPKQAYALLFRQARKYGVSLLAATQSITDVDYKALGQVNTWCLGRLVMPQDIARVEKLVESVDPVHTERILATLPGLGASEFFLVSPDAHGRIVRFRTRGLATHHRTLEEGELADAIAPSSRAFFEKFVAPVAPTVTASRPRLDLPAAPPVSPAYPEPPGVRRTPPPTGPARAPFAAAAPPPSEAPSPVESPAGFGGSPRAALGVPPSPAYAPTPAASERASPSAAPPVSAPPPLSTPAQEAILEAVRGARETVPADAVATATGLPPGDVARELKAMVAAGVLATGRWPGSKVDLYWPAEEQFLPSVGLTREVLGITMKLAQVDAVKRAASWVKNGETIAAAEIEQLPIWKVTCKWTPKGLLSGGKERSDDYYVSARSGAFMTIEGKLMRFEKVARKSASRLEDIGDKADVAFEPTLPSEIGPMPPISVSLPQASEILRTTFGVIPVDGRLALLPIWHIHLQSRDGSRSERVMTMDAVSGKAVSGEY